MAECPDCGNALPDEAEFCAACLERYERGRQDQTTGEQPDLSEAREDAVGEQADSLEAPPEDELERIREELLTSAYVAPWEGMRSTPGEKGVALLIGAAAGLLVGCAAGLLPVPFVGLLIPFPVGVFVGWMVKNNGGLWAMAAAGLPAVGGTVVGMQRTIIAFGRMLRDVLAYYYASHLQLAGMEKLPASLRAGTTAITLSLVMLAIGIPLLLAYSGGSVGERLAKGPGYGL